MFRVPSVSIYRVMRYREQTLLDTFAENLRTLRTDAGHSQESFALEVGMHRTYISHIERATVNLSLGNAARIADALDVTLDEMITDSK